MRANRPDPSRAAAFAEGLHLGRFIAGVLVVSAVLIVFFTYVLPHLAGVFQLGHDQLDHVMQAHGYHVDTPAKAATSEQ